MTIESMIADLAAQAKPVRPARGPWLQLALWLAGAIAYVAALLVWLTLRPDLASALARPMFAAELGLLALLCLSTLISAALLSAPDMYQQRRLAMLPGVLFAVFALFLFFAWRADVPPVPLPPHNMECLACITAFSVLPALWMFSTIRRRATTHAGAAGSVSLLAGFSIGALALRLSEETFSIAHVVLWHYLPMIAIGAIGLMLGRKFLRW